jgi:phage I-like protein
MARAHEDAVDFGIVPESDAYFQFVENRLGINAKRSSIPEVESVMSEASSSKQRRSSPPSAPVSRQPIDTPHRPGVITLTAAEVEAAKISGISPQEYYRNKMREQNRLN